jgi:hypothetical protein
VQKLVLPKNLSPYELFISSENFRLAWERIRYFDRRDSRDWIGLKVFAANRDYNLEALRQSVSERTFEPSYPEIRYMPKPSLTLRPMAVLAISDRVVFQAIANVIAEKARAALAMIASRQSFANVLREPDAIALFVHWKLQYRLFQNKFCELVQEGNIWLAETDAAAFYETIDHRLLMKCLTDDNGFLDEQTAEYLQAYLPIWSSVRAGSRTPRGVPQGCLASDLLADVFLYEFDRDLASQEYHYLRYVDDIRLLGKTKEAIQRGLIRIDIQLKSFGILLQTKKTTFRRITDIGSEVDRLAAQLSEIDRRLKEPDLAQLANDPILQAALDDVALLGGDFHGSNDQTSNDVQDELHALFWQSKLSIDTDGDDPFAERHLRFCLYRLEPDQKIVDAVLPYFVEKPWLSELISWYLQKCNLSEQVKEILRDIIANHNVYDSIVAFAIDTLVRQKTSLLHHHALFRKWLVDGKKEWSLLCNAAIALGESSDNMSALIQAIGSPSPSVRRMIVIQALRLARTPEEAAHICKLAIHDSSPIVIDTLLYLMYNEWSLTIGNLSINNKPLSYYCITSAKGYDNSLPLIQQDYIRHIFIKSYEVMISEPIDLLDLHALFGKDYGRAAHFLWWAEVSYLTNPSRYVTQLDLFHEELLYPILIDKLNVKPTRHELAHHVELGNRIDMLQKQKKELANFVGALLDCHRLRANPETHSRLHRELTETRDVTWQARNALKKKLCAGYQELVDWLILGCP